MRPPSTSAIAARAATNSLVFFNNRLSPPLLLTSPVEVCEGPSGFGSEAGDRGESKAGDRNRRQRDRAEVRDDREVENDQGAGNRDNQWVRRSQAKPSLQKTAECQRYTGDSEERDRDRDHDHERDNGEEDQCEPEQGNCADREQESGDARRQSYLGPVAALEALDRDPGAVGKQQQHGQGEQHQTGPVAEKGAKGLQRAHRAEAAKWRTEADALRKSGLDESLRIGTWSLGDDALGRTDQECRIRPERGAVERGVGYRQKHAEQCERCDHDWPVPTSKHWRWAGLYWLRWLCRRLLRVAGRRAFTFVLCAHARRCSRKRGVAVWSSFARRERW